jgi:hypothetical protein
LIDKNLVTFSFSLICYFWVSITSYGYCHSAQDNNEQSKKTGLFRDANIKNEIGKTLEPFIVRSRFVEINFDVIIRKDAYSEAKPAIANMLGLNLFDNVCFTAVIDRLELRTIDNFSWIGHIKGMEPSEVILVLKDSQMVGNIRGPDGYFQIRYVGDGVHAVREIDPSVFIDELEPIPVE